MTNRILSGRILEDTCVSDSAGRTLDTRVLDETELNGTTFSIERTGWSRMGSLRHRDELVVRSNINGVEGINVIYPSGDFATVPYMDPTRAHFISAVQIIPILNQEDEFSYRLVVGTDQNCCNGAVFDVDLNLVRDNETINSNINLRHGVQIPFNIGGVLGTNIYLSHTNEEPTVGGPNDIVVYGAGCDGSGIQHVRFSNIRGGSAVDSVMSTEQSQDEGRYQQFFHRPELRDGEIIIPSCYEVNRWVDELNVSEIVRNTVTSPRLIERINETVGQSRFLYSRR
ncbi:hypothetical protein HOC13_04690 [Candidatus Woesearchaeota archaeon]|jgi:hypothetical protein|nr:hypothetical protein [Candidatus Woesearchaeota archaeon]